MKPSSIHSLSIVSAIGLFGMAGNLSASTLYEETFAPGSAGTLPSVGWAATGAVGYSGTYAYAITNAATLQPINGQSAVYLGNGTAGQVMGFYTTDTSGAGTAPGSSGAFSDLSFTGSLNFGVYNQLQGGGSAANESAYFLIQDGGNWYASATQITGPTDTGNLMDLQSMVLNPTAADWVNVSGIGTGTVTYGSTPSSSLGNTITGAGVLFTLNNSSYQTANYSDFTIGTIAVAPEPGSIGLLALGGLSLITFLRRRA